MSLFRRRESRADRPTSSLEELFLRRRHPQSTAGQHVDADTAMRHMAVWSCVDLIAAEGSTLPISEYRGTGNDRQELTLPPLFESPDGELEFPAWLYQVYESLLKRGNAYGQILTRDSQGWPANIKTLHADSVQPIQRGRNGPVEFKLEGKPIQRYDPRSGAGELWHVPAYLVSGCSIGLSPIGHAAASIGIGLAAMEFGANWFRDGAIPSALLMHKADVSRDAAKLLKQRYVDAIHGTREPFVLGGGWEFQQLQVAANESQFLDTIKATKADIAGFYRLRPERIGAPSGNSMTYANVEQSSLDMLTYTLNPWVVWLERALTAIRPRPRYVKFNVDAFLRTDAATRWSIHDKSIRMGVHSVNEVRAIEDEPGIGEDGDRRVWPPWRMQLTTSELEEGADSESEPVLSSNGSS